MIRRLLADYGEVISTPLPESTITDLAALAEQPRVTLLERYWHHRAAYDLGQPSADYWSEVLARDLSYSPQVVAQLTDIDVHGWLGLNSLTLRTLVAHVRRTGVELALLSNAPEPLARAIDRCFWSRHFDHRYYSCRLGAAKPDPQAFQIVLNDLGAQPSEVLLIDDRARTPSPPATSECTPRPSHRPAPSSANYARPPPSFLRSRTSGRDGPGQARPSSPSRTTSSGCRSADERWVGHVGPTSGGTDPGRGRRRPSSPSRRDAPGSARPRSPSPRQSPSARRRGSHAGIPRSRGVRQ